MRRVGTITLSRATKGIIWEVVVNPMLDEVCISRFVVADDGADMWNLLGEVVVGVAQYIDGADSWNGKVCATVDGGVIYA